METLLALLEGRLPADCSHTPLEPLRTPGSHVLEQLHPASYTMGHQGPDFLEL